MSPLLGFLHFVLLALAPAQQTSVEVDAERDFPGISALYDSDFGALYGYERFDDYHGKKVSPEELARLKREWEAARQKGDAERARLEADPTQFYLFKLERTLKRRNYFRDLEFERVDEFAPFYLIVEKTKKPGFERFTRQVADFYGPWLRELLRLFEEEYARPLQLQRRKEHGAFALLVLADVKAYQRYYERLGLGYAPYVRAHYDPELQLGVTYEEPSSLSISSYERRMPALHEMVHAFEYAYGPARPEALQVTWFAEGFADYLAHHVGNDPNTLRQRPIDGQALRTIEEALGDKARSSAVFPLEELVAVRGYQGAIERALERARALQLEPPQAPQTLGVLYDLSYLWMHFLHHGESGKYRDGIKQYIAAAIQGELAGRPIAEFLAGAQAAELDAAFIRYVATEWQRSEEAGAAPVLAVPRVLAAGARVGAGPSVRATPVLALEPELEYAALLALAREGRFAMAAERASELLARTSDQEFSARLQRERVRLEAVVELRRRFFEHLSAQKDVKLRLPPPYASGVAWVEGLEGAVVRLDGKNRSGVSELRLEELPASYLASEFGEEKRYAFRVGWILGYVQLLSGDAGWQKTLARRDEPEARELDGDGAALAQHLARGAPAAKLVELVRLGEGSTPEESRAIANGLLALLAEHASDPAIGGRRDALVARARAALGHEFDAGNPADKLKGRWEDLGDGRVRLHYGFDAEAELEDFRLEPLDDEIEAPEELEFAELRLEKSSLVGLGFCRIWHDLELAAPVEIAYEFTEKAHTLEFEGGAAQIPAFLCVGLLARGLDDLVAVWELSGIYEVDKGRPLKQIARNDEALLGKKYKVVVSIDEGGRVSVLVNDEQGTKTRGRPGRSGALFLQTIGRVELHSLTMTGKRTPDSLARWREVLIPSEESGHPDKGQRCSWQGNVHGEDTADVQRGVQA